MVPYLRPLMVLGKSLSIIALRTSQETDFAVQNKSMHKLKCLKIPFHLINKVKLHGKTMDCHPLNFCKMYMPLLWQSLPNISTRKSSCTIKFYRLENFYSRCRPSASMCKNAATKLPPANFSWQFRHRKIAVDSQHHRFFHIQPQKSLTETCYGFHTW